MKMCIRDRPYSYEKAIERYKLALYNTLVKKGKNSEKAYECLKISWLYRGDVYKRQGLYIPGSVQAW